MDGLWWTSRRHWWRQVDNILIEFHLSEQMDRAGLKPGRPTSQTEMLTIMLLPSPRLTFDTLTKDWITDLILGICFHKQQYKYKPFIYVTPSLLMILCSRSVIPVPSCESCGQSNMVSLRWPSRTLTKQCASEWSWILLCVSSRQATTIKLNFPFPSSTKLRVYLQQTYC